MIANRQGEGERGIQLSGSICPICGSKTEVKDVESVRVRRCRKCGYTERYRRVL